MVPATSAAERAEPPDDDEESNTSLNALVGAVAGVVLSFIPLSTLLGGAVAGYLEGGESSDGLRVGAIAGLMMLVPLVFIVVFVMLFLTGAGPRGAPVMFFMMTIVMFLLGAVYTVGLGAVGGYLGVYLKNEL
jgi:hypothetical protein